MLDPLGGVLPNRSYGYNAAGAVPGTTGEPMGLDGPRSASGVLQGLLENKVVAPADMIAVVDFDPLLTDDDHDSDLHVNAPFMAIVGRHAGRANALLCDWHVECGRTNLLRVGTLTPRYRWNYDHQPH